MSFVKQQMEKAKTSCQKYGFDLYKNANHKHRHKNFTQAQKCFALQVP